MTFKRSSGGVWSDITTTLKRRLSGAWVDVETISRRAAGAWVVVWKRVVLNNQAIVHSTGFGSATAGYRLNASGIVEKLVGASYSTLETWLSAGVASGYECRATVTFGTLTGGTTGSWLALSSSREWYVQRDGVGTRDCTFTIEIRNATTLAVVGSATIDLSADRF